MHAIKQYLVLVILWIVIFFEGLVVHAMSYPGAGLFLFGFSLGVGICMTVNRLNEH